MIERKLSTEWKIKGKVLDFEFENPVYSSKGDTVEDLIQDADWMYSEGNFGCDCNKRIFACVDIDDSEDSFCGDSIKYQELFLVNIPSGLKIDLLKVGVWLKDQD